MAIFLLKLKKIISIVAAFVTVIAIIADHVSNIRRDDNLREAVNSFTAKASAA